MNVRLLYIYIALVVATVIMSIGVWLIPNSKDRSQNVNLQQYLNIKEIKLKGGGTGFLSEDKLDDIVALDIIFKGGISIEPLDKKGISSILANTILSGGSSKEDNNEIKNLLKKYSIKMSVSADLDNISFNILSTKDNIKHTFDILALVLKHNNFNSSDLKIIKANTLLDLKLGEHYTNVQASKALYSTIFNNNPKFNNIFGTKESISSITIKDLIAAKSVLLTKNNVVIGARGSISKKELEKGLNKAFASLDNGKLITFSSNQIKIFQKVVNIPVKESTNSNIYVVMPMPQDNGKDRLAATIVNNYMGSGFNSLLVEEVRVKKGLVYTISSELNDSLYGKFWVIKATTANSKVKDTLNTIKTVLADLQKKKYDKSDINNVKQNIINSYLLNFDNNQSIASSLSKAAFLDYSVDDIYNRALYINKVNEKNIKHIIDNYININNLTIIVAGAKI